MKNDKYILAKKDFDEMIKNASKEDILKVAKSPYGLTAAKWAGRYIKPKDDQKTYNQIYDIFFGYFDKFNKKLKEKAV